MLIVYRKMARGTTSEWPVFIFACGYLASWVLFSIIAAVIQWWLHGSGLLGGELLVIAKPYAAAILVATGLYQLTPFKNACLERCRSPMGYFLQHFKRGNWGRVSNGFFPRAFLYRLLLDVDGFDVCRRRHERVDYGGVECVYRA